MRIFRYHKVWPINIAKLSSLKPLTILADAIFPWTLPKFMGSSEQEKNFNSPYMKLSETSQDRKVRIPTDPLKDIYI